MPDVAGCDVVIEAVVENADVKRQIYRRLEPLLQPHTILATNTSTIRITSAGGSAATSRSLLWHAFF